jgi:nucleotide-binding universal stress UspA family protein
VRVPFRTVLCPTDLSEEGNEALPVAYAMVAPGGEVHRLHVLVQESSDPDEEKEVRRRLLEAPPGPEGREGVATHVHVVRDADVASAIERTARFHEADAVVMATHGRGRLARLIMGSVGADLVRRADLPVILVRGDR